MFVAPDALLFVRIWSNVMTLVRLIPFAAHGAIELLGGLALLLAPFALGFSGTGMIVSLAIGAVMVGLALSATSDERDGLPLSAHVGFDRLLALVLIGAALLLSRNGDYTAALALAIVAAGEVLLTITTRYSFSR
jgi:hypothetical protein